MNRAAKFLGVGLLVAVVGTGAWVIGPARSQAADAGTSGCQMKDVFPSKGTLQLQYLRPSSPKDPDRNDYKLSGTLEWDSQAALDCFATGRVDWAYEHSIEYGQPVKRLIWNEDFSSFGDAQPYLDTTVDSNPQHTELTVGIAKPERLKAGHVYQFSYDLLLANQPKGGKQWIALWPEVVEKQCSSGGAWCSGLNTGSAGKLAYGNPYVGWTRGFAVTGTTCWSWADGRDPVPCPTPIAPTPSRPPNSTPTATPTPTSPTPADTATPTMPPSSPPTSPSPEPPPPPSPPPSQAATAATAQGTVNGCNTYGQNCDGDPIYVDVPADGYDWHAQPKVTTVPNGTPLSARCYAIGAVTYNWAVSKNDPGPNPYDSNVYYSVLAPTGSWGFIPDTYFQHDKVNHMGLQPC